MKLTKLIKLTEGEKRPDIPGSLYIKGCRDLKAAEPEGCQNIRV